MTKMILLGAGGSINPDQVLMIASLKSAPIKRLLRLASPEKVINMTYGYPQRSLLIFENGMLVISRVDVDELTEAFINTEDITFHE
jgi:regulator of extracellular matrix RemA (YlzA/DUF370 family)